MAGDLLVGWLDFANTFAERFDCDQHWFQRTLAVPGSVPSLSRDSASGFRSCGLQPRNGSPWDLVSPRAILISAVCARTSPARARMTMRRACPWALRCFTGASNRGLILAKPARVGHPTGRPSAGSPRLNARCAHAPRSLRVPTRSIAGLPRASAFPFPTRSGSAACPRTLLSWPSESCSAFVPQETAFAADGRENRCVGHV
jgi:hypothetical protein